MSDDLEMIKKRAYARKAMLEFEKRNKNKEAEDLSVYEAVNPNDFESEEPEMFRANAPLDYDALKSQKIPKVLEDKKKEADYLAAKKKESDAWYAKQSDKATKKIPSIQKQFEDTAEYFGMKPSFTANENSGTGAFLRGMPSGLLLEFDDELLGGLNALVGDDVGTTSKMSSMDRLKKRYRDVRDESRKQKESDFESFPAQNIAGNIAGGLVSALAGGAAASAGKASTSVPLQLAGKAAGGLLNPTSIPANIITGSITGIGLSKDPLMSKETLVSAATGGALGGALAGGTKLAGKALKKAGNVAEEVYANAAKKSAQKVLNIPEQLEKEDLIRKELEYLRKFHPDIIAETPGFTNLTEEEVSRLLSQQDMALRKEIANSAKDSRIGDFINENIHDSVTENTLSNMEDSLERKILKRQALENLAPSFAPLSKQYGQILEDSSREIIPDPKIELYRKKTQDLIKRKPEDAEFAQQMFDDFVKRQEKESIINNQKAIKNLVGPDYLDPLKLRKQAYDIVVKNNEPNFMKDSPVMFQDSVEAVTKRLIKNREDVLADILLDKPGLSELSSKIQEGMPRALQDQSVEFFDKLSERIPLIGPGIIKPASLAGRFMLDKTDVAGKPTNWLITKLIILNNPEVAQRLAPKEMNYANKNGLTNAIVTTIMPKIKELELFKQLSKVSARELDDLLTNQKYDQQNFMRKQQQEQQQEQEKRKKLKENSK